MPRPLAALRSIQHAATLALGRLAAHSRTVAALLAGQGFQDVLVAALGAPPGAEAGAGEPEQAVRRAACMALRGLTRHDAELAGQVASAGAAEAAVACLAERSSEMQEAAAWVLGNLAGGL